MKADKSDNFQWDKLLEHIRNKNIIPVIGHGLYHVEIETEGKKDCLLYEYLTHQVLEACNVSLNPEETHQFAKACLEFLKNNNNNYLELSEFLKEALEGVRLIPDSSLGKLARIKPFNMLITTAYDNLLVHTIKTIRSIPLHVLYYTMREKNLSLLTNDLFDSLENYGATLVYHMFGNMENCMEPAYTERDILETIVEFQKDMINHPENSLFMKLRSSSLLFIGCGFDDWLFRFFIRTVANEPYEFLDKKKTFKFVGDDFVKNKKDPFKELPRFLKNYETELFHSPKGSEFVDMLLQTLERKYPEEIIRFSDFPGTVFISFEGKDRPAARRLTENLRNDGFDVWLDEREFHGGDLVDQTIIKAIDKCSVFIPLVSQHSQQIQTEEGKLKYHLQEWEYACDYKISSQKLTIIPVIIDNTKWVYDKFRNFFHLNIPAGGKQGDYNKLRNQLQDM